MLAWCTIAMAAVLRPAAVAAQTAPPLWREIALPGGVAAAREALEALAGETGGEAFFTSDMGTVASHLLRILEETSTQYLLGYAPQKPVGDGAWRAIEVTLAKKDVAKHADVRTRAGYFATRRAQ